LRNALELESGFAFLRELVVDLVHDRLQYPARDLREPLFFDEQLSSSDLDMPETLRCNEAEFGM